MAVGLPLSEHALSNSLTRLSKRGMIMSPWKDFYVIVPTEYKLRGIVPPSFYIDRLMNHLGKGYYVSLLSAAELNGAAHQRAMVFQVTVDGAPVRSGIKNGTRLEFTRRCDMPMDYVTKVKTQMGYMNVSGPELTALDIVDNEQKIGGLSRASEVLVELSESIEWDASKLDLLSYFRRPAIQRLGYLLDTVGMDECADNLFRLASIAGISFRKVPLKQTAAINDEMTVNARWKIIENYQLDIDEI